MTNKVIARVRSVHLMNVEQRQAAADPQTNPSDSLVKVRGPRGSAPTCLRQVSPGPLLHVTTLTTDLTWA